MFTLEALQAKHGDCLLLRWVEAGEPRTALIDGGPGTIYENVLAPRLQELADERGVDRLPLDLVLVSHIDDDHINGILDLAIAAKQGDAPAKIGLLWHNSLEGLLDQPIGNGSAAVTASTISTTFPNLGELWAQKVLSSVPQGQQLHGLAVQLGITDRMNEPFQPLIVSRPGQSRADIGGMSMTIIAPAATEVENLRKAWVRLRKEGVTAANNDTSVYNLSSIVVLAEFGGKRMLLTGDARGDHILEGLASQDLLSNGRAHFNLFKLPHHGSRNNVEPAFFEAVTADAYVVSGDHGRFPNPHEDAMRWLANARGNAAYTVYCTYDLAYMRQIFGDKLRVPVAGEMRVAVDLA